MFMPRERQERWPYGVHAMTPFPLAPASAARTPAAAGMDRLSDRLGAILPGGSLLPPRHPAKVSLVMAFLGLASGWLSMALGTAASLLSTRTSGSAETPIFLTAGAVQALVVVAPWACWSGIRWRWIALLIAYCFLANIASFFIVEQLRSRSDFGLFVFGLLTGLYLSLPGLIPFHPVKLMWSAATAVICALVMSLFELIRDQTLLRQVLPGDAVLPMVIAWFFSLIHLPGALCLGFLLWDTAPRGERLSEEDG
jgi:hypothetical protein